SHPEQTTQQHRVCGLRTGAVHGRNMNAEIIDDSRLPGAFCEIVNRYIPNCHGVSLAEYADAHRRLRGMFLNRKLYGCGRTRDTKTTALPRIPQMFTITRIADDQGSSSTDETGCSSIQPCSRSTT